MSPRQILLLLAAAFVAAGLVLGLRSVSVDEVSCGSVFQPSDSDAKLADQGEEIAGTLAGSTPDIDTTNNADDCAAKRSDAKPLAYGGVGVGVIALIAAFIATPAKPTNPDGTSKPSIWR